MMKFLFCAELPVKDGGGQERSGRLPQLKNPPDAVRRNRVLAVWNGQSCFLCFAAQSFLLDWRERAMPSAFSGTSSVMTLPAAM